MGFAVWLTAGLGTVNLNDVKIICVQGFARIARSQTLPKPPTLCKSQLTGKTAASYSDSS
jgi:hypothetical protein